MVKRSRGKQKTECLTWEWGRLCAFLWVSREKSSVLSVDMGLSTLQQLTVLYSMLVAGMLPSQRINMSPLSLLTFDECHEVAL